MGRRVVRTDALHRRLPWTEDDVIELLAHLDFMLARVQQEKVMESKTIVLRELARCIKSRSQTQIQRKLTLLVREYSAKVPNLGIDEIYRLGTRGLNNLPYGLRTRIKLALEVISTNTPRKTRSVSRIPERTPASRKRSQSVFPDPSPSKTRNKRPKSQIQSPLFDQIKVEPLSFQRPLNSISRCTSSPDGSTITMLSQSPEAPSDFLDFQDLPQPNGDISRQHATPEGSPRRNQPLFSLPVVGHSSIDYGNSEAIDDMAGFLSDNRITTQDLFEDNQYFHTKVSTLEEKVMGYEENRRIQHSLNSIHSSSSEIEKLRERVRKQHGEINSLKQQLHSKRLFENLLPTNVSNKVSILLENLESYHMQLIGAVKALGAVNPLDFQMQQFSTSLSPDLADLEHRAFGANQEQIFGMEELSRNRAVFQALVGAALCNWVFLDTVQWMATISTPLVEVYRRHINSIWGEDTAYAIDTMAHDSLLRKGNFIENRELSIHDEFQEIFLTRTAKRLTKRFLDAIECLFDGTVADFIDDMLQAIFISALNLKIHAAVGRSKILLIWPPHGCHFSTFAMSEDGIPDRTYPPNDGEGKKVLLCLAPGIQICPDPKTCFVDYSGFPMIEEYNFSASDALLPALVVTQ